MSTHEEATPFVGDITTHWCDQCQRSTLQKAPIHILTSDGPRRIGEWAVCEGCGHSPYAHGGRIVPRDHGDDIPLWGFGREEEK